MEQTNNIITDFKAHSHFQAAKSQGDPQGLKDYLEQIMTGSYVNKSSGNADGKVIGIQEGLIKQNEILKRQKNLQIKEITKKIENKEKLLRKINPDKQNEQLDNQENEQPNNSGAAQLNNQDNRQPNNSTAEQLDNQDDVQPNNHDDKFNPFLYNTFIAIAIILGTASFYLYASALYKIFLLDAEQIADRLDNGEGFPMVGGVKLKTVLSNLVCYIGVLPLALTIWAELEKKKNKMLLFFVLLSIILGIDIILGYFIHLSKNQAEFIIGSPLSPVTWDILAFVAVGFIAYLCFGFAFAGILDQIDKRDVESRIKSEIAKLQEKIEVLKAEINNIEIEIQKSRNAIRAAEIGLVNSIAEAGAGWRDFIIGCGAETEKYKQPCDDIIVEFKKKARDMAKGGTVGIGVVPDDLIADKPVE